MAKSVFTDRVFVVTGTLSSMSRKDAEAAITAAGGRITGDVSKTANVLVVGDKPGSKVAKAESLGVEIWDENKLVRALKQAGATATTNATATKQVVQQNSRTKDVSTKTTPTKKALAEKAPAKKPPAERLPAKKPPAQRAPANKPAAAQTSGKKAPAKLAVDEKPECMFTKDDLWIQFHDGRARMGLTDEVVYANVGLLVEEWLVSIGDAVTKGQKLGSFSGSGDVEVRSPIIGIVRKVNPALGDEAEDDGYEFGWPGCDSGRWRSKRVKEPNFLCEIEVGGPLPKLLTAEEYAKRWRGLH